MANAVWGEDDGFQVGLLIPIDDICLDLEILVRVRGARKKFHVGLLETTDDKSFLSGLNSPSVSRLKSSQ